LRRLELGLTQAEAAAMAGISREQLSKLESGQADPHLSTLAALANALCCAIADVLPLDGGSASTPGRVKTAEGARQDGS
jgi:transcriptional regulator with XRE-family HTH domain